MQHVRVLMYCNVTLILLTDSQVKFSVMSSTRTDNVGTSLSSLVDNLKADTEYDFMVFATNGAGDGDVASLEVTTLAGGK